MRVSRRRVARGAALVLIIGWAWELPPAEARPGGGQSYSGRSGGGGGGGSSRSSGSSGSGSSSSGSSSSSSSGSSSAGQTGPYVSTPISGPEMAFFIFMFGALGLVFLVFAISSVKEKIQRARRGCDDWDSGREPPPPAPPPPSDPWTAVRAVDPDFSAVLFDDFIYALYATAQRARHDPSALAGLRPYLTPKVQETLRTRAPVGAPVVTVVVGALRITRVAAEPGSAEHYAIVEIESNLTLDTPEGPRGEYGRERWQLSRAASTRTRPWTGVRTFGCPSCGAPFTSTSDDRCASCGEVAGSGRFDWRVISARLLEGSPRPPALTGTVEEQGTLAPTVVDPEARANLEALSAEDPGLSEEALFRRAEAIFLALHPAWASQDLRGIRPYVSDAMFNYLSYWVEAYRAQGLRNAVLGARITRQQLARVVRDRHFDAATIRVWATGNEVTTEAATGKLVGGSRTRLRPYSEYWTLIRGASVRGTPRVDASCPSCGAPLAITMAGHCEYCGVHVTSGEFDWVLSRIEQDDSYGG